MAKRTKGQNEKLSIAQKTKEGVTRTPLKTALCFVNSL
jgi:hypothetical protein